MGTQSEAMVNDFRSLYLPNGINLDATVENGERVVKKTQKCCEKVYESGPDGAWERYTIGSDGKKKNGLMLVLLPTQKQYYTKDAKGTITPLTVAELMRFFSFLQGEEHFSANHAVFNLFRKKRDFCERVVSLLNDEVFIELAKKGLITLKRAVTWRENNLQMECLLNNSSLIKKMIVACADEMQIEYVEALERALSSFDNSFNTRTFKLNISSLKSFILFKNVYGEDVAYRFFEKWVQNDALASIPSEGLLSLFLLNTMTRSDYRKVEGLRQSLMLDVKPEITFQPDRFIDYFLNTALESGLADRLHEVLTMWKDTLAMQETVYGKIVDKYPKNLLVEHSQLAYRVRILKKTVDMEKWDEAAQKAKTYEGKVLSGGKEWVLLAPTTPDDVYQEAQNMSNCVSSYISRMIQNSCTIMFLRKADCPSVSECTVELRGNEVVQVKARFNRKPSGAQYAALTALCKKIGLIMKY